MGRPFSPSTVKDDQRARRLFMARHGLSPDGIAAAETGSRVASSPVSSEHISAWFAAHGWRWDRHEQSWQKISANALSLAFYRLSHPASMYKVRVSDEREIAGMVEISQRDIGRELHRRLPERVPSINAADDIAREFLGVLEEALMAGQAVTLTGIGRLEIRDTSCFVPSTRKRVPVRSLRIVPSRSLKEKLNLRGDRR